MTGLGTIIYTKLNGEFIGTDHFGNKYYQSKRAPKGQKKRRWVVYKGLSEPSKVPAEWHGWLHYTTDKILKNKYDWQKEHLPNLTGTGLAYNPPGHIINGGKRKKATGDYLPWQPVNND